MYKHQIIISSHLKTNRFEGCPTDLSFYTDRNEIGDIFGMITVFVDTGIYLILVSWSQQCVTEHNTTQESGDKSSSLDTSGAVHAISRKFLHTTTKRILHNLQPPNANDHTNATFTFCTVHNNYSEQFKTDPNPGSTDCKIPHWVYIYWTIFS